MEGARTARRFCAIFIRRDIVLFASVERTPKRTSLVRRPSIILERQILDGEAGRGGDTSGRRNEACRRRRWRSRSQRRGRRSRSPHWRRMASRPSRSKDAICRAPLAMQVKIIDCEFGRQPQGLEPMGCLRRRNLSSPRKRRCCRRLPRSPNLNRLAQDCHGLLRSRSMRSCTYTMPG